MKDSVGWLCGRSAVGFDDEGQDPEARFYRCLHARHTRTADVTGQSLILRNDHLVFRVCLLPGATDDTVSTGHRATCDAKPERSNKKETAWLLVRKRTIPIEGPPPISEFQCKICG
jgi:hypothetical protein